MTAKQARVNLRAVVLMRPAAAGVVLLWPVSRAVNSVRNNGVELLNRSNDPAAAAHRRGRGCGTASRSRRPRHLLQAVQRHPQPWVPTLVRRVIAQIGDRDRSPGLEAGRRRCREIADPVARYASAGADGRPFILGHYRTRIQAQHVDIGALEPPASCERLRVGRRHPVAGAACPGAYATNALEHVRF
jgi:hypothetical protein